jgi:hypothetical protein
VVLFLFHWVDAGECFFAECGAVRAGAVKDVMQ